MTRRARSGWTWLAVLVAMIATWGCGQNMDTGQAGPAPEGGFSGGPGPGGRPGGGPGGGGDSAIKQAMRQLDKGPNSLKAIDSGLKAQPPEWATIQPQTAEYAKL